MTTLHVIQGERSGKKKDRSCDNPLAAATRAKEAWYNLDMMKRRMMVLQGQEDYNRYKTLDHEKRIDRHMQIHSKVVRDNQTLRQSLEKVRDKSWAKQKADFIRNQLKFKANEARRSMIESRTDRTQIVNQESAENESKKKEEDFKFQEGNRSRREYVQGQEQQTREMIIKHLHEKMCRIKQDKQTDATDIVSKVEREEQALAKLAAQENELIQKNSASLQASQVMRRKYNDIFTTSSLSGDHSRLLPDIRARTNNSKQSNNTSETPNL